MRLDGIETAEPKAAAMQAGVTLTDDSFVFSNSPNGGQPLQGPSALRRQVGEEGIIEVVEGRQAARMGPPGRTLTAIR
jgi:hypothetical protein